MKKLLDDVLLVLQTTTYDGVSDFNIENGHSKFKYFDCEFYIKRRIRKLNNNSIIGELKLYQNTQNSFPPNPPTLEEIEDFNLTIYPNHSMHIKNYIDFSKNTSSPTLHDGQMSLVMPDIPIMYFKQLENKLIKEEKWLWIAQ